MGRSFAILVSTVVSNVAPGPVSRMVKALAEGRTEDGQRLAQALDPLFGMVTVTVEDPRVLRGKPLTVRDKFRNPLGIKTLMHGLGMISGGCRQPLGKMTPAGVDSCGLSKRLLASISRSVSTTMRSGTRSPIRPRELPPGRLAEGQGKQCLKEVSIP